MRGERDRTGHILISRTVQVGIKVEILGELSEVLGLLFLAQSLKLIMKD